MAYDQMIGEGNAEGNKIVQDGVDALVAQARAVEAVVAKLGLKIELEGSDSLDNPSARSERAEPAACGRRRASLTALGGGRPRGRR